WIAEHSGHAQISQQLDRGLTNVDGSHVHHLLAGGARSANAGLLRGRYCPAAIPVSSPFSSANRPFTNTASIPAGRRSGWLHVERSEMVCASKMTRSAL